MCRLHPCWGREQLFHGWREGIQAPVPALPAAGEATDPYLPFPSLCGHQGCENQHQGCGNQLQGCGNQLQGCRNWHRDDGISTRDAGMSTRDSGISSGMQESAPGMQELASEMQELAPGMQESAPGMQELAQGCWNCVPAPGKAITGDGSALGQLSQPPVSDAAHAELRFSIHPSKLCSLFWDLSLL